MRGILCASPHQHSDCSKRELLCGSTWHSSWTIIHSHFLHGIPWYMNWMHIHWFCMLRESLKFILCFILSWACLKPFLSIGELFFLFLLHKILYFFVKLCQEHERKREREGKIYLATNFNWISREYDPSCACVNSKVSNKFYMHLYIPPRT